MSDGRFAGDMHVRTLSAMSEHKGKPPMPIPSASILLISPSNQILLLHRVENSRSFPSAHVFPGGHIAPQDGTLPAPDDVKLHEDSKAYRLGAIRECFEESGILLARNRERPDQLLQLNEVEREWGRHAVHNNKIIFTDWVHRHRAAPDTAQLSVPNALYIPTPDGSIEHTAARFLYPSEWLSLVQARSIRLLPPQFFLLSLIAQYLFQPPSPQSIDSAPCSHTLETLAAQRKSLLDFVRTGDPPWGEKCISPWTLKKRRNSLVMGLDLPGPELEMTNRRGDDERVIFLEFGDKGETSAMKVEWRTSGESPGNEKL
ncbi:MAG: hypothetical protein Q9167_002303 [Letrouitia subvulpina]